MTYLALSLPVLAAAALAGLLLARRLPSSRRRLHRRAVTITVLVLVALTAVFDSLMIAARLFHYAPAHVLGPRLGLAPIEDFAYPLVTALLLPGIWIALTHRRGGQRTRPARRAAGARGAFLRQTLLASRPVSWVNTAYPFAAAMLLTTREVDPLLIVGTIFYLIPYNLAMYGINDVFDYASDVMNPRKGGVEGALLAPSAHRPVLWLALLTNAPFVAVLAGAGGPASWAALAVSSFAVVAYSAPPMRFKERPVLDSLTSSTHFVSPAVVGLTLAGAEASPALVTALVAFFLWGMAAHAFGAVQDIIPDREAGIGSIASAFGARRTVRTALALWLAAGLLMLTTPWPGPLAALVAVPYLAICAPFVGISDADSARSNLAWRRFIRLNYVSGFLVTLILILLWQHTA